MKEEIKNIEITCTKYKNLIALIKGKRFFFKNYISRHALAVAMWFVPVISFISHARVLACVLAASLFEIEMDTSECDIKKILSF